MNGATPAVYMPVLRRPRRQWRIPQIQTPAVPTPALQPGESICWEGTTPEGREILRKLLFRADRMANAGTQASEIVAQLKTHLDAMPELQRELGLIFSRLCGVQCPAGELTVNDLAVLIAMRVGLSRQRAYS